MEHKGSWDVVGVPGDLGARTQVLPISCRNTYGSRTYVADYTYIFDKDGYVVGCVEQRIEALSGPMTSTVEYVK